VSIGSIFSVARTAMNAHQAVVQVAGHNIANAETEGYSRQVGTVTPNEPERREQWVIGTGASLGSIERVRDENLDATYRSESSKASGYATRRELLGAVEEVFGEPSDDGLASQLDAFWGAWSDLASNPSSSAARTVVQQRGAIVASTLNAFDARLQSLHDQTKLQLSNSVQEINALASQVASLNTRIVESEAGGAMANDLRDARDVAIDKLSKLGDVRVIPSRDHSVQVLLGSNSLVDSASSRAVRLQEDAGGTLSLRFDRASESMLPPGGALSAMMDVLNVDLAAARGRLDAMAQGLVDTVNTAHRLGQTFDAAGTATAAGDFFHPGDPDPSAPGSYLPVTAADIRLSDAVRANPARIAASAATPSAGQVAGPGNNEVALALAGLRDAANTVSFTSAGGATEQKGFAVFYRDMTGRIGTQVQDAESSATVHETLVEQTDRRRASESGVNVDEELTTLMRAQQAYAAAAKVITIAQELLKTIVEMV
jgi:flagellar hook-associated protein 1